MSENTLKAIIIIGSGIMWFIGHSIGLDSSITHGIGVVFWVSLILL